MAEEKSNKVVVKAIMPGTGMLSDNDFDDAVAVELDDKHLKVIGARGQVVAIYAPGCWADVYVA